MNLQISTNICMQCGQTPYGLYSGMQLGATIDHVVIETLPSAGPVPMMETVPVLYLQVHALNCERLRRD